MGKRRNTGWLIVPRCKLKHRVSFSLVWLLLSPKSIPFFLSSFYVSSPFLIFAVGHRTKLSIIRGFPCVINFADCNDCVRRNLLLNFLTHRPCVCNKWPVSDEPGILPLRIRRYLLGETAHYTGNLTCCKSMNPENIRSTGATWVELQRNNYGDVCFLKDDVSAVCLLITKTCFKSWM